MNVLRELKKRGYAETTIKGHSKRLRMLNKHIDLNDPEAVKSFIASQSSWSNAYKESCVNAYTHYARADEGKLVSSSTNAPYHV